MKLTHPSLLIPLLLALSPLARAEDAAPAAPAAPAAAPAESGRRAAEFLKKYDKDGDGKLSDEEKAAAKEAMKDHKPATPDQPAPGGPGGRGGFMSEEIIKKYDKDGDGKLNDEEKAAAREGMREAMREEIKQFDKDGDGKLNDEERLAAFTANLEKHPEMKAKILERFDENKDGQLSPEELKKAAAARRGGPGAGPGGDKGPKGTVPKPKEKDASKTSN